MNKLLYSIAIFFGVLLAASSASAISTFITLQGGTGTSTPSGILYGDNGATSHLNTATIGAGCTFSGGTLSCAGSGSYPFTVSSAFGVTAATSSVLYPAGLATGTSTIGKLVATSSITNLGVTSALVLNSAGGLEGAYSGSSGVCTNQVPESISALGVIGTCTSINNSWWNGAQLTVGNGGTGQVSFTSSQLLYGNGTNALSGVSTSTLSLSAGLATTTGTLGALVGGTSAIIGQTENRGFSYATTTAWTGTTTIQLGVGYGERWQNMKCYSDVGTLNMDFYHASTHFTLFNASTTVGTVNANNSTNTIGDKLSVDIGTPASSPTKISCTINDIN